MSKFNNLSSGKSKYHGLHNQGATCYLNSVLQVLFMTEDFREALKRHTCDNSESIDRHLKTLFENLQRDTTNTIEITRKLGINTVYEQRDAAEYFEKILNLSSSEASQIFHLQLTHRTICSKCKEETSSDSLMWHLPLSLTDACSTQYSLVDSIQEYFKDSHFSGLDQMYCDQCDDKVDATIKCEVKHHPEVLVLLLKRFEFDYRYMSYVKNNCVVDVPSTLHIPENQTYELYACVDHFGDLRGGHYTATIKSQDDNDEAWYDFDDARVTLLSCQPYQLDTTKQSRSVYLLFYRKQKTTDTCNANIRNVSTSECYLPATSDNNDRSQDTEETFNNLDRKTPATVIIHRHEETSVKPNVIETNIEVNVRQSEAHNHPEDDENDYLLNSDEKLTDERNKGPHKNRTSKHPDVDTKRTSRDDYTKDQNDREMRDLRIEKRKYDEHEKDHCEEGRKNQHKKNLVECVRKEQKEKLEIRISMKRDRTHCWDESQKHKLQTTDMFENLGTSERHFGEEVKVQSDVNTNRTQEKLLQEGDIIICDDPDTEKQTKQGLTRENRAKDGDKNLEKRQEKTGKPEESPPDAQSTSCFGTGHETESKVCTKQKCNKKKENVKISEVTDPSPGTSKKWFIRWINKKRKKGKINSRGELNEDDLQEQQLKDLQEISSKTNITKDKNSKEKKPKPTGCFAIRKPKISMNDQS